MRVIDLTHTITQDMPVYPGTDTPRLTPSGTYENDAFAPQEALFFLRHRLVRVTPLPNAAGVAALR